MDGEEQIANTNAKAKFFIELEKPVISVDTNEYEKGIEISDEELPNSKHGFTGIEAIVCLRLRPSPRLLFT